MRALQRRLVSVIITLLNDSERSLNQVTNKSNPRWLEIKAKTPFYLQFKLFHFIYPHQETCIVIPKIESENNSYIVRRENPLLFWYPSLIFGRYTYRLESRALASTEASACVQRESTR